MREILFRAKHKEWNEWVEGDLIHEPFGEYMQFIKDGCRSKVKVDPETVCQYTGLTDKNGRKIFEGDIAKDNSGDLYTINWSDENGIYEVRQYSCSMSNFETFFACDCEVIGNIFDNPELMSC